MQELRDDLGQEKSRKRSIWRISGKKWRNFWRSPLFWKRISTNDWCQNQLSLEMKQKVLVDIWLWRHCDAFSCSIGLSLSLSLPLALPLALSHSLTYSTSFSLTLPLPHTHSLSPSLTLSLLLSHYPSSIHTLYPPLTLSLLLSHSFFSSPTLNFVLRSFLISKVPIKSLNNPFLWPGKAPMNALAISISWRPEVDSLN